MSNRFVDTEIHKKAWFRLLSPELKAIWKYLTEQCDYAGVWEMDHGAIKFYVGSDLTIEQILEVPAFKERFQIIEDKLFCPGFVVYQYRGKLNLSNSVHLSVIARLSKLGIEATTIEGIEIVKGQARPGVGSLDKDIDTVKDKELEKEISEILKSDYPLQTGIGPGVEALLPQIKSPQDVSDLRAAAKSFKHHHIVKCRTDLAFIPQAKNWAKEWREWVETGGEKPSVNLHAEEHKKLQEKTKIESTDEGYKRAMDDPELQKKLVKIGFRNKNKKIYED